MFSSSSRGRRSSCVSVGAMLGACGCARHFFAYFIYKNEVQLGARSGKNHATGHRAAPHATHIPAEQSRRTGHRRTGTRHSVVALRAGRWRPAAPCARRIPPPRRGLQTALESQGGGGPCSPLPLDIDGRPPDPRFADDRYGSQSACSPPFVRRPPPPERGTVSASRDWRDADVPTVAIAIAIPRLQVNDVVASAPAAAIRGGPLQSHPSVLLQHTPHSPGPSPGASGGGFSWYEWRVATSAS